MRQNSPLKTAVAFMLILICPLPGRAQTVEELKAGVVKITAQVEGKTKVGTGTIVRLDGDAAYIVTASHVIEGDPEPKVAFFTRPNRPLEAKVIGMEGGDPRGLAALFVEGQVPSGLKALPLDQSVQVSGGEAVTLIGFPKISGTPWAVTTGTIAGRRGSNISFSGVADEGNSGGPLLLHGKVVGIITRMTARFGHGTPTVTARFALEGWGVRLAQEPSGAASGEVATVPTGELSDIEKLDAALRESGMAASTPGSTINLTGSWKNVASPLISYMFEQQGTQVKMVEITSNLFGSVLTAQGEGQLDGRKLTLSYVTTVGTTGHSVMTLSEDGDTMGGSFTDLVTGVTLSLSLSRETSGPATFPFP